MDGFVHLHVHSEYSLLDGANRIGKLANRAGEMGMDALALTDHGNLFGAIEFYTACRKAGIKPILGIEAYISPTTRADRSMGKMGEASWHIILLAMNEPGWRNLIKLTSRAYLEGFYYRPRIDRELLGELDEGLVCLTACMKGEVPSAFLSGQDEKAERIAGEYLDIFGRDRFFMEVQNQSLPDQAVVNAKLVALAGRLGVGVVGTNDVHFLTAADKPSHEVLTCISTGKTLADGGALEYSPQLYLKDPREMREALRDWSDAADNTLRIAEMCSLELDFSRKHLPRFATPNNESAETYLRRQCEKGLKERFGKNITDEHRQRMDHELKTIEGKGYCSYVLIVHDMVQFAKSNGIPCGARGSGCATLMGYCLGISNVDPMRYGLLFERFTDPQREEDPDFDIDICQEGRPRLINYVREKYGHVAQIITFGTLKARAAVRDVGRVLDIPLPEVDAIAKKVPDALGMTLQGALAAEPALKEMVHNDERIGELFDHAQRLEGLSRHAGVHAAGVVVADEPLENLIPLCKQANSDDVITQWDGPTCDKIGLMKMDFLGLRTLTTIQRARELTASATGKDIDPETIPLDDQEVFELFRAGRTDGIFQFESGGMQDLLRRMKPDRIEDLIAANAMYRPGPMELIGSYCARKDGSEEIPSVHSLVDDILAETYGIMVYQEQVMQVLNRLGKLPLNTALTLIKAISKKKERTIAAERPAFLAGAKENGIESEEAERLFDLILRFAGYGFNKAHSTRYAIIAYQTAYFKRHYPRQFMAALLTFESGDTDKVVQYMSEAKRMGITVGPPDINASGADFTVDGEKIRFGLAAVKGVGQKAVAAIIEARENTGRFEHLYHFCENVDLRLVNRSTIEALIKCGAFDSLGAHRAAMLAAVDRAIELGNSAAEDRRSGQMSFFGAESFGGGREKRPPQFPDTEPLSEMQLLTAEKETLGFYITSHPLVGYGRELDSLGSATCAKLAQLSEGATVTIGCMIASVRQRVTKSGRSAGRKMAILTIEDLTGSAECVVFAETFDRMGEILNEGAIVFLTGKVDRRRQSPQIIVDQAVPVDQAIESLTGAVTVRLEKVLDENNLEKLGDILSRHRGQCPVHLEVTPAGVSGMRVAIRSAGQWSIAPDRQLYKELCELAGNENVVLIARNNIQGGNGSRSSQPRRQNRNRKPAAFPY
ncbi:MAG: DNA polymerase III subunit alpha [Planctomycetota bacterium]|nr:DNA polymerase III subunit alpha [Planctomycetota bacterium]